MSIPPLVKERDYIGQESRTFLKRYYGGNITSMLSAYLENDKLSEAEIDQLRSLLARRTSKEKIPMDDFMIRFGLCNLVLCGAIGILLLAKKGFQKSLSSRMQYHLWFLLLGLLAVPFLPLPLMGFPEIFSWLKNLGYSAASPGENTARQAIDQNPAAVGDWMNDFALSVDKKTASAVGNLLFGIWIAGILVMLLLLFSVLASLPRFKKSALPLQNPRVRRLYQSCLNGA